VTHRNFRDLSPGEAQYELSESRRIIAARTGITATEFAIPFGQSTDWSPDARRGKPTSPEYAAVYAQSELRRPPGTVARTFVTRFDNQRLSERPSAAAFDDWEEWV